MSSSANLPFTTQPPEEEDEFPIVIVVCALLGVFLIIAIIVVVVKLWLQKTGVKFECCQDVQCCVECGLRCDECLQQVGESCNCDVPTCGSCLDSICPTREQCSQCDICLSSGGPCCVDMKCDCCGDLSCVCPCGDCNQCCDWPQCECPSAPTCQCCGDCHCAIRLPECQDITCLCFECGRAADV
ncbi:keratin-associated protein 5-2-like [Dysidea avara]|uniref:keratin-associated protein 5-2-like n=1 Tax=Dysidea avara TaxID=196820 RepID=UPI00332A6FB5